MNDIKEMGVAYEKMLKESAEKTGTVNTKVKAGDSFEGSDKAKKMSAESGPEGKDNKIDKPAAGPSAGDDAVAQGKGKPLSKKEVKMKDSTEEPKMSLSFDDLYNKVIKEEADDIVPAPDIESSDFDEKTGDFTDTPDVEGETTDVDEEIDLASELRLLADRLNEIADKFSGEAATDELAPDEEGLEDTEIPPEGEGVQTEAIKSEPTPKAAKKTTLGPKMSQNPKNKIGKSGAKTAAVPSAKQRDGTISQAPKTTLGPKMSQNPSGNGPAVKGGQTSFIA